MQASFDFPPVPKIQSAVIPKNEQGASGSAHKRGPMSTTDKEHNFTADAWIAIPIEERFELLATIAEMREWRGKPSDRPIRPAALALHQWLKRHADVR
jgi:hypothetical protein